MKHSSIRPELVADGRSVEVCAVEASLRVQPDFLARHPPRMLSRTSATGVCRATRQPHGSDDREGARPRRHFDRCPPRRSEACRGARRAILALLGAPSSAEVIEVVDSEWSSILGVDVVLHGIEGQTGLGLRRLPRSFVRRTLGIASAVLRDRPTACELIPSKAAALVAANALAQFILMDRLGSWRLARAMPSAGGSLQGRRPLPFSPMSRRYVGPV